MSRFCRAALYMEGANVSMNTKITFFNFLPFECGATEEYLEAMAERGWLLRSITGPFLKFTRIEPKKLRYSVDILNNISSFDHMDRHTALEYRGYRQAAGWNYVCEKGKLQIFYIEDDKETVSVHTDEEEKYKAVFKASLSSVGSQVFLIVLFVFNLYTQLFLGSADHALATNLGVVTTLILISVCLINSIEIISFFLWVIKAKTHLRKNTAMPYNKYKQLKIKNIFIGTYEVLTVTILVKYLIFDGHASVGLNIALLMAVIAPIIILAGIQRFIYKKRYSKKSNIAVISISAFVVTLLVLMIVGAAVFRNSVEAEVDLGAKAKANLSLMDFIGKDNYDVSPYISYDKSILAERLEYISGSQDNNLSYTVFQSQYHCVIKFDKDRLLSRLSKYGDGLIEYNTTLPSNIKVYTDNKQKKFILVSEDKVVDIRREVNGVSNEEFLSIVYKKLF